MSEENVTDDFFNSDSVCNTCIGLSYYDTAMQSKKLPFICYGIRGTSEEESATVVEEGIKEYTAEFESYACLGKSIFHMLTDSLRPWVLDTEASLSYYTGKAISTGRMERQGIAPIRVFGMESVSRKENKANKNEQRNKMLRERQMTLNAQNDKKTSEESWTALNCTKLDNFDAACNCDFISQRS